MEVVLSFFEEHYIFTGFLGTLLIFLGIPLFFYVLSRIVFCVEAIFNYNKISRLLDDSRKEIAKLNNEHKKQLEILNHENYELDQKIDSLEKKINTLNFIINNKNPLRLVSELYADVQTIVYNEERNRLRWKKRPALTAAETVTTLKKQAKELIQKERLATYRYQALIKLFPALEMYAEDEEYLTELSKASTVVELDTLYDHAHDYLSNEEWQKLSSTQRSQLALDRYIANRKKTKWAIGRDYEMSCGFVLQKRGYRVSFNGIEKKFEDLGRDIIAHKEPDLFNSCNSETLIVQCKCWQKERVIRENVIMQLFGSTVAYKISSGNVNSKSIIPVLMIPSFSTLSPTALAFTKVLKIRVDVVDFMEFPRVKCNINSGNKIYHLPFDQQYDRTQIKNPGETYAYTVAEAEKLGFRRANRHLFIE